MAPNVSAVKSHPPHRPFMGLDTDLKHPPGCIEVQSIYGGSKQCSPASYSNYNIVVKFQPLDTRTRALSHSSGCTEVDLTW